MNHKKSVKSKNLHTQNLQKKNLQKIFNKNKNLQDISVRRPFTHLGQNVEKVAGDAVVAQPIGGGRRIDVQRFERVPQTLPEFLHLLVHARLLGSGANQMRQEWARYKIGGNR